jgi:hypothetical protein
MGAKITKGCVENACSIGIIWWIFASPLFPHALLTAKPITPM